MEEYVLLLSSIWYRRHSFIAFTSFNSPGFVTHGTAYGDLAPCPCLVRLIDRLYHTTSTALPSYAHSSSSTDQPFNLLLAQLGEPRLAWLFRPAPAKPSRKGIVLLRAMVMLIFEEEWRYT